MSDNRKTLSSKVSINAQAWKQFFKEHFIANSDRFFFVPKEATSTIIALQKILFVDVLNHRFEILFSIVFFYVMYNR